MAEDTETGRNPFAGFGEFLIDAPLNLAKLPITLARTILNTPQQQARNAAGRAQSELRQEVTGEKIPFSPGRNFLNALTLGAIPGSPSAGIDPSQLTPDQMKKFKAKNPLQQALLDAESPQDFANIVQNDEFFQEREPAELSDLGKAAAEFKALSAAFGTEKALALVNQKFGVNLGEGVARIGGFGGATVNPKLFTGTLDPGQRFANSGVLAEGQGQPRVIPQAPESTLQTIDAEGQATQTGAEPVFDVGPDRKLVTRSSDLISDNPQTRTLAKDSILADARGGVLLENRPTIAQRTDPKDLIGTFTLSSIDKFQSSGAFNDLELDEAALKRSIAEIDAANKAGQFDQVEKLREHFLAKVKGYFGLADEFRGIVGAAGIEEGTLPPDLVQVFANANVDLSKMSASGIRDIALIFAFMKILDPISVVRDSEAEMVASAQAFGFAARTIRKLFSGETLNNDQRIDILNTIRSTFQQKIKGYIVARQKYMDIARFNGFEPVELQIPDMIEDLRSFIYAETNNPGMIDQEGIDTIFDAFEADGGNPDDIEAVKAYSRTMFGFEMPDV